MCCDTLIVAVLVVLVLVVLLWNHVRVVRQEKASDKFLRGDAEKPIVPSDPFLAVVSKEQPL